MTGENEKQDRLKRMIRYLKSLKGPTPDYDNLDFSNWKQCEEEYQKEQKAWSEKRKGRLNRKER